ncbi:MULTISPECIES: DUF3105 domain-containing protein [unclassified Pseudonocardia]|uniref:DUF3105 domain-containing protein n=1 Tax=unclassified Pseudonocardia TaxID=2619320 RepID=UPI0009603B99|nr:MULTISPECIES: DUF3105 domain-containing protein [unclassified Pseudonocardia]MBN9098000.1 DUF3105 domain-containing protein [Pseudonocardia sp.]OJY54403.1 MAG: hypothetical protein BGP03_22970 [Pseudonocardia sp. 73-21]
MTRPDRQRSKQERRARAALRAGRSSPPWSTIAAVVVVVLFAGGVFGYAALRSGAADERAAALAGFVPSADRQDPSTQIPGIVEKTFDGGQHVTPAERVAYTTSPPLGGTHDQFWAACTGVVYAQPVRTENLVHSMEHGAAWIAYDPARVSGGQLDQLAGRVRDQPYTALSPYPGLDQPISLQSWGHQLTLTDAADPRVDQFLTALRRNPYTHPENGASCQALGPGQFDQDRPPPYQPPPPSSTVGTAGVRAETEAAGGPAPDGSGGALMPGGTGS